MNTQAVNKMMKKSSHVAVLAGSVALSLALLSTSAQALVLDTLLGSEDLGNSSEALEKSTLAFFLGVTADSLSLSKVESGFSVLFDSPDQYYLDIAPNETNYFILKFGTGNTGFDDTYFFRNIGELDKLVWNNVQVNGLQNELGDDSRLSHYSLVNGDGGGDDDENGVPEPGMLFLMGAGLLGLGLARRRKSA